MIYYVEYYCYQLLSKEDEISLFEGLYRARPLRPNPPHWADVLTHNLERLEEELGVVDGGL